MPRSASRDRSDPFAGRRGYFRRPTRLATGGLILSLAAALAASTWVLCDAASADPSRTAHSHGELAHPHAAWENDCAACHASFAAGDFAADPASVFHARQRWQTLTCQKCHAGPPHHKDADAAGMEWHNRCDNCHSDHKGRSASLTRPDDSRCVRCHADLSAHTARTDPDGPIRSAITDFATDHPPFRSLEIDRKLKFSHSLHMTPGIVYESASKAEVTLAKMPAGDRPQYARFARPADGQIKLECSACHALDSELAGRGDPAASGAGRRLAGLGQPVASLLPPRAKGAHYQPVNYDLHCRTCHPVGVPAVVTDGRVIGDLEVPHRIPSDKVMDHLTGRYAAELTKLGNPPSPRAQQPGGRTDPLPDGSADPKSFRDRVAALSAAAQDKLFRSGGEGCMKCHVASGGGSPIAPILSRTVWMPKAKFDHTAHRSADCAVCHPGTEARSEGGKTIWTDREPVLIRGLQTCRVCHSPAGSPAIQPDGSARLAGGVRHGCTDCHGYHNGDHPLQGRGAAARNAAAPKVLLDFFSGK